jgi:hypothetical protein
MASPGLTRPHRRMHARSAPTATGGGSAHRCQGQPLRVTRRRVRPRELNQCRSLANCAVRIGKRNGRVASRARTRHADAVGLREWWHVAVSDACPDCCRCLLSGSPPRRRHCRARRSGMVYSCVGLTILYGQLSDETIKHL